MTLVALALVRLSTSSHRIQAGALFAIALSALGWSTWKNPALWSPYYFITTHESQARWDENTDGLQEGVKRILFSETAVVVADAASHGLRVGSAPDTFMGAGLQSARRAINEGLIGTPVSAFGFMLCPGHESWHPNPDFYYTGGGGLMFDMGPYYVTGLVNLLGSVTRVSGARRAARLPNAPSPAIPARVRK